MNAIEACEPPPGSLLQRSLAPGSFSDCYTTEIPGSIAQQAYVEAFYTTPLFKIERTLLRWLLRRPSTDAQAGALARGDVDSFAAWRVEARTDDQLLLADFTGRTRSWLMSRPSGNEGGRGRTRLYFGSGVGPRASERGDAKMGFAFVSLLGFHRLYSRSLLGAARSRLLAVRQAGAPPCAG